jgi:hypothetical protein
MYENRRLIKPLGGGWESTTTPRITHNVPTEGAPDQQVTPRQ